MLYEVITLRKAFQKDNKGEFTPEIVASAPYKNEEVVLSAKVDGIKVQFYFGETEETLKPLGEIQDYTLISDEVAQKFNGVYVGMYATSTGEESKESALFDWFWLSGNDR